MQCVVGMLDLHHILCIIYIYIYIYIYKNINLSESTFCFCSTQDSPSNKLLYAKEISTYKKMVDE